MNGQIAVDKWKAGGFHLVLMDIQMPVMNGLQATKEIRRLERANSIGVFSSASHDEEARGPNGTVRPPSNDDGNDKAAEQEPRDDTLPGLSSGLIKSPVIIVALTASSLQSDRHEALAAGCNDFLTKPVNFVWLERKVKEWGCMQALIDFDGWRKWKEYAGKEDAGKTEEEKAMEREKEEKERVRAEKMTKLQEKQAKAKEEREKKKRMSLNVSEGGAGGGGVSPGPASPGLPATAKKEEGDVNGTSTGTGAGAPLEKVSSASLKPGRQVLGDACFDLG
jgi:osomolarity two-component system response regulator SSK1